MTDRDDLDVLSSEEVPDDANVLQCGFILKDGETIGFLDQAETDPDA